VTSLGIEIATFRLVAKFLNQLCYRVAQCNVCVKCKNMNPGSCMECYNDFSGSKNANVFL
jgi:hypothetical protein